MSRKVFLLKQTALVIVFAGFFAMAVMTVAPMFADNIKFLIVLPFAGALFMVLALNFRWTLMFILCTRSMLDPLLTQTKMGGGAGIGGLLNLFVIVMVAVTALRFPDRFKKCRHLVPWAFFLGAGFLTIYFAPERGQSLRVWLTLLTYACMFTAPFLVLKDEKDKAFWVRLLILSSFFPMALALGGYIVHYPPYNLDRRLNGTFAHANILAFYTVLVVTLILYALKTKTLKLSFPKKAGLTLYLGMVITVLLLTQTRSAWVSCFSLFFVFGLLRDRRMLILFFVGLLAVAATPPVQTRLKDLTSGKGAKRSEKLNSMAWRVRLWQSAVPSIVQSPVLGHGLGTFQYYSKDFFPLEKEHGAPAHSVYVEAAFEVGLAGLLAYLSIFVSMLKALYRRMRRTRGDPSNEALIAVICIINYLIVCYSDNMQYYLAFNWYFWFFCGLMLASIRLDAAPAAAPKES